LGRIEKEKKTGGIKNMNMKIALVLIAIVGIGLYALPSTVALFSGQHDFKNIDATGNQIDCLKCHGDVKADMTGSGTNVITGTPAPHAAFKCEYCHRIEAGSSSGDNAYGRLAYKGPSVTRYLVVTITDMEAGNVPIAMTVGDNLTTVKTQPTISGIAMGKFSLSNCLEAANKTTACTADATKVLTVAEPDMRLVGTYNAATGTPKDPNPITAAYGFDVSRMTFNYTAVNTTNAATATDNLTNAGSRTINPGTSYHAASLVSCLECHRGDEPMGHYSRVIDGTVNGGVAQCSNCHYGGSDKSGSNRFTNLWAGGFGLTTRSNDTGATEAHNEFTKTDDKISRFEYGASNGACVACHTHVEVDITYQKPSVYKFDANFNTDGKESVGGFSAQGAVISNSTGS
jgi:hypothetical protein